MKDEAPGSPAERVTVAQDGGAGRLLGSRLFALFCAGCLLFGYPVLGLIPASRTLGGVPLLYVYIFGAWAAFIAVLAWMVESADRR